MPTEYLEQQLVQSAWAYRSTSPAMDALLELPVEAFQGHVQRHLWEAMRHAVSQGKELTEIEVMQHLQQKGLLGPDGMYWQSYRGYLQSVSPQPVETLRDAVWQGHVRREGAKMLQEAANQLEDSANHAGEVIAKAADKLSSISVSGSSDGEDVFGQFMADIAAYGRPVSTISKQGIFTCSDALHRDCPFPVGGVHITAATRNTGKTIMLITAICETIKHGHHVTCVSLDMPGPVMVNKIASAYAGLEQSRVEAGELTDGERTHLINCTAYVRQHVNLFAFPCLTVWDRIEAAIVRSIRKWGSIMVALDHFGQIGTKKAYGEATHERKAYISHSIKNIAQKHQIAFALAVQINRQGAVGEPGLSDLAETTALEQDAMSVCVLWPDETLEERPEVKGNNPFAFAQPQTSEKFKNVDTIKLRLAKNQVGPAGKIVNLRRLGAYNRFEELERYSREF